MGTFTIILKCELYSNHSQYTYSNLKLYHNIKSIIIMNIRKIILFVICFLTARSTIVITNPLQTEFTNNQLNYLYLNFG